MEIDVLGLGESLKEYKPGRNLSFGVNDIEKYHKVDYLVCFDRPRRFDEERRKIIINSTPRKFYTHIDDWKGLVKNLNIIILSSPRGSIENIESENICYSNNSPYVAIVMAYKMGAKKINIFGVDFNNHPHFKGDQVGRTLNDFKQLFDYLKSKDVHIKISKGSKLNEIV